MKRLVLGLVLLAACGDESSIAPGLPMCCPTVPKFQVTAECGGDAADGLPCVLCAGATGPLTSCEWNVGTRVYCAASCDACL